MINIHAVLGNESQAYGQTVSVYTHTLSSHVFGLLLYSVVKCIWGILRETKLNRLFFSLPCPGSVWNL